MRILLLGDASNFHATLAHALRQMGHEVVLASHGSQWMNTQRDIDLYRQPGMVGTLRYGVNILRHLPDFRNYDVVQVTNPIFFNLRPEKISILFDYLCAHNKKVVYEALGTDSEYVKACIRGDLFQYSDFRIQDKPSPYALQRPEVEKAYFASSMLRYHQHFLSKVDGIIACLYEYYKTYQLADFEKPLAYGGIPITIEENVRPIMNEPEKVKFFIGIQRDRSVLKGTDVMLKAVQTVVDRNPARAELVIAENMPYDRYVQEMKSSHVLIDQLYSYTPATNALLAMSKGLIAVSGAEPEYYDFIGEDANHPIINVSPIIPNDIPTKLEWIVNNKHLIPHLSQSSMLFVKKHNDSLKVAQKHVEFWQNL